MRSFSEIFKYFSGYEIYVLRSIAYRCGKNINDYLFEKLKTEKNPNEIIEILKNEILASQLLKTPDGRIVGKIFYRGSWAA